MSVAVAIFAHQEEKRIATCLTSLPLDRADTDYHVLINGTTDATLKIAADVAAGRQNLAIHDIKTGGKSRTWNHFVHQLLQKHVDAVIFLDGDAEIAAGSIDALVASFKNNSAANAVAGMPLNGRQAAHYRQQLVAEGGIFGDLYALSGSFVKKIQERGLYLPDDLIGDDGLIAAWAHTDLGPDNDWVDDRVAACPDAGFICEPVSIWHPDTWHMQYRRMINYSVRYYQNRIVSDIMKRSGPMGLPRLLSSHYAEWLPRFSPRALPLGWFDRKALARMRKSSER